MAGRINEFLRDKCTWQTSPSGFLTTCGYSTATASTDFIYCPFCGKYMKILQ